MTLAQLSALIEVENAIGGNGGSEKSVAAEPERGTWADLVGLAALAGG
jgi:hypothetical protein